MSILYKILFIYTSVLFATMLCGKSAPVIQLTLKDSGKTLVILKKQGFTLTLISHIDGGYRFDKAKYDTTVLQLCKLTEIHPTANGRLGDHGRDIWQFIAKRKGRSALIITASRPWAHGNSVTTYSSVIIVK